MEPRNFIILHECYVCKEPINFPRKQLIDEHLCKKCQTTCQICDAPVMSPMTNSFGTPIDKEHLLCIYCFKGCYEVEHCSSSYKLFDKKDHRLQCGLCCRKFEPDYQWNPYGCKYYAKYSVTTGLPICDKCYLTAPKSDYCRTCHKRFPSRNKLFNHLKETDHYIVIKK